MPDTPAPHPPNDTAPEDWQGDPGTAQVGPITYKQPDPAYWGDPTFYKTVIRFLGGTVAVGVAGILALSWQGKESPDGLIAIISTAVGALAGVLTSRR